MVQYDEKRLVYPSSDTTVADTRRWHPSWTEVCYPNKTFFPLTTLLNDHYELKDEQVSSTDEADA